MLWPNKEWWPYLSQADLKWWKFHLETITDSSLQPWLKVKVKMLVTQSCLALYCPLDCSPPGSSVHEIFQAKILEWFAISFSRASSQPRNQTWVSFIVWNFFTLWVTREAPVIRKLQKEFKRRMSSPRALLCLDGSFLRKERVDPQ